MISEFLAYALGRAHGREEERRRRREPAPDVYDSEPTTIEMVCACLIVGSIAVLFIFLILDWIFG